MTKSKLYLLIKTLSSQDRKKLYRFLKSEFCNSKEDSILLFEFLHDCLEKSKDPVKQEAFNYCYNKKDFKDEKLRLNMAHCLKQVERYIVFMRMEEPLFVNQRSLILQQYYRENHLIKSFNTEVLKFKKHNDQNTLCHHDVLEEEFKHGFEIYEFNSREKRNQTHNLQGLYDQSEILYYARSSKLACYILSHSIVYQQEGTLDKLNKIIQEIETKGLLIYPSIAAYYYGYQLLASSFDINLLQQFKKFIDANYDKFPVEENRTLYFIAINNSIKNFNRGMKEFGIIGLEFYKNALKNKILMVDGFLSRFSYRNIAMLAIRCNEIKWAEQFTITYASSLRKKDKKNAMNLNLAMVYFYQNNFNGALECLQDADFKDHLIHLSAKNLQCKIYFELEAYDALEFLLDAMTMYIKRNKIIGYHRDSYLQSLKYFRKLNNLNVHDRERVLELKSEILEQEKLLEKDWLVQKIQAIK